MPAQEPGTPQSRGRTKVNVKGDGNAISAHGSASINYSLWLLDITVDLIHYPDKKYITPGEDQEWAEDGICIEVKNNGKFTQQLDTVPALIFANKAAFESRYPPIIYPVEELTSRRVYHVPADDLRKLFADPSWKEFGLPHMVRASLDVPRPGGDIRILGKNWFCCSHIAPYWMPEHT